MIIVTGGAGFIGSNLIKGLNERSFTDILIVDELSLSKENNISQLKFSDVISPNDFYGLWNHWTKVETVFHEGAISSTVERDPKRIEQYNLQPTYWLIEQAVRNNFILSYASSASVYGDSMTFSESQPLNPGSLYASSKMMIDHYAQTNLLNYPNAVIQGWRYFNVYGSNESHKENQASPVTKFVKQAKETGTIKVFKNSENFQRDFICVDDIVNVKLTAAQKNLNGIYNLGTGNPTSFKTVADLVAEKYQAEIKEIDFPKELVNQYQKYTCSDNTKLFSKLGEQKFKTVQSYLSEI